MADSAQVLDLRHAARYVDAYVRLRNRYVDVLLATPVGVDETQEWLRREDIEVRALVRGGAFLGAAVLYLARDGEIAVFVEEPGRGLGTRLLRNIEEVARQRGVPRVWAWVLQDNVRAQRAFEKRGFVRSGTGERTYHDRTRRGVEFSKSGLDRDHGQRPQD